MDVLSLASGTISLESECLSVQGNEPFVCDLLSLVANLGTETGRGWPVWMATQAVSGDLSHSSKPLDLPKLSSQTDPSVLASAAAAASAGFNLSVAAFAAGGLSSSGRDFNNFSLQAGVCNNSTNSSGISEPSDTAVTASIGGSFSACLCFAPGDPSFFF